MRTIAIINEKDGVGKTTTAINLAAALLEQGHRTLLIDLDPQAGASRGLGVTLPTSEHTIYPVLRGDLLLEKALVTTGSGIDLVPSHLDLVVLGPSLQVGREMRLRSALSTLSPEAYEFVLLDCPPSLDCLTLNALAAAGEVLIPLIPHVFSVYALLPLIQVITQARHYYNPALKILGIVPSMCDTHKINLEREVLQGLPDLIQCPFLHSIRRTVKVAEAPARGMPVLVYAPRHPVSEDFRILAREVLNGSAPFPNGRTG